ncbi:MAG TPA: gliding motility-associated C-terminal domain-containing protein, partial [Hanamia sp.]
ILVAKITVFPNPDIQVSKSNDITCFQSSTHLIATGADQYSWAPSFDLDNSNIANPTATPSSTTVYTVTGKDINGCSNSDTISVKVAFDRNTFLGLPNSFTPNGDGLNDCFGVSRWGQVSQLDFSIYNRFGQRVFHTNNSADCWDGNFQGKQQNQDVYVYTIKATMACGKIDKKGTVMLLR